MRRFKKSRVFALLAVALIGAASLTGCDPAARTGPNKVCPQGWQRVSTQSWWQKADSSGSTAVPQSLPSSNVGGHLHVETCFPVNLRVDGDTLQLTVDVKTHQKFTGQGTNLDVGLAPGGESLVKVPMTWNSKCPSGMCSTKVNVTVPLDDVGSGNQILRIRYLPANQPNGERQFASNELPFFHNQDPSGCPKATEGKGWYDTPRNLDYARAGINGCLPGDTPKSGVYTFNMRSTSTNYPIAVAEAHIDARYGSDDFSGLIPGSRYAPSKTGSSNSRVVNLDTRTYADGWHCLSVLTSVKDPGSDAVNTGVQEFPILIDNSNDGKTSTAEPGHGSCYDTMPAM
jgi:hypothetical protein